MNELSKNTDKASNFSKSYLDEAIEVISLIDIDAIEKIVSLIKQTRTKLGRIFFLGVGGSAGNCSHAVNDFRKLLKLNLMRPLIMFLN